MRELTLVRRNLGRNRTRAALMLVCIAVAFMIYGVLAALLAGFQGGGGTAGAERLVATNRAGIMQTLPLSHARAIARIQGVALASPVRFVIGYWREAKDPISVAMVEAESYLALSPEAVLTPADRAAFLAARDGLIVGRQVARRYGWKRGDQVTLTAFNERRADGERSWRFTVSGIYSGKDGASEAGLIGHYGYFNEGLLSGPDRVSWVILKARDAAANDLLARRIDEAFANSAAATRTQSEAALGRAFLAQVGDIVGIVRLIVGAAFVVILFVVGNTMVFSIAERTREIGVLKTLGFSRGRIARLVGGEAFALAIAGGLTGLCLAALIVGAIAAPLGEVLPGIALTGEIWATAAGLIVLLALLTGFMPVLKACRLNIVDALGRD